MPKRSLLKPPRRSRAGGTLATTSSPSSSQGGEGGHSRRDAPRPVAAGTICDDVDEPAGGRCGLRVDEKRRTRTPGAVRLTMSPPTGTRAHQLVLHVHQVTRVRELRGSEAVARSPPRVRLQAALGASASVFGSRFSAFGTPDLPTGRITSMYAALCRDGQGGQFTSAPRRRGCPMIPRAYARAPPAISSGTTYSSSPCPRATGLGERRSDEADLNAPLVASDAA